MKSYFKTFIYNNQLIKIQYLYCSDFNKALYYIFKNDVVSKVIEYKKELRRYINEVYHTNID